MMSLKKVVLARRSTVQLDNRLSAAQLLKASYLNNHHSFHFLLSLDSKHSFMGSTPERLYSRVGHELHTEALAGTIGRGDNATHDMELANWLSQDSKNLNENQYVVDDIVERLSPHSEIVEVETEPRLVRLRKVQHLKRNIHASLKTGTNGVQLLSALQRRPQWQVCLVKSRCSSSLITSRLLVAGMLALWGTSAMNAQSFVWQ